MISKPFITPYITKTISFEVEEGLSREWILLSLLGCVNCDECKEYLKQKKKLDHKNMVC